MVKDSVGVIFGKTESLSFMFAVSDSTAIKKSDYLKIWHESDGWTLAQVSSITRSSEDFSIEKAVDVAEGSSKVGDMNEQIIAQATVIGSRDKEGILRVPKSPFSPGDKVFKADELLTKQTLGLMRGDIYIGLLEGQNIRVNLDANNLVQKHCSILAKTGAGKSYTSGVILEELLDKSVPLLIIDPHGEYGTLKFPNEEKPASFERYGIAPKDYAAQITVYTPANMVLNPGADELFRLNGVNLGIKDFMQFFSDEHSQNQTGILFEAISKLKTEKQTYTIDDIISEVGQNKSKAKWNVINRLEALRDTGILSDNATTVNDLIQEGRASIIDMKGVNPDLQAMIVAKLCNDIFEARKLNTVPPCMLVIEEAHNFCPEKGFGGTVSTDILRTIASEGRKFGLGLMVVSQRPARVDKNILSQCNTQIIMKVTNPNDLKAISKGLEGISSGVEEDIKSLSPGVAMIVSNYIERPVLVDVRIRKSKHGGASVPVVKAPITDIKTPAIEKIEKLLSGQSKEQTAISISSRSILRKILPVQVTEQEGEHTDQIRKHIEQTKEHIEQAREHIIEFQDDQTENEKPMQKKPKAKHEVSLYTKMFGSRKK
ncbi:putative ATPase [Candidatus Methanoperedens nitroreducens]|uniref:Putative ATPase n=1 Tax=Candidatus Methanoperedens nitratireducens TaxID=1392998 RepID=A0A062V376_9EURY|nr:ATP-binding protein [Candidatus Methanoperedens nitroreducens]KCZ73521.1 putative ATPase [Candidatus Methanoperedens nitroreducens]MDJ1422523.1 ATP-binding protein [Candidatus Methanoperedens sp.]